MFILAKNKREREIINDDIEWKKKREMELLNVNSGWKKERNEYSGVSVIKMKKVK